MDADDTNVDLTDERLPIDALRTLVNGFQVSHALHIAATLGIADLLRNGAMSVEQLATVTDTHAPSLYRLLRALASVGVFHETADHRFALTDLSEHLRSDARETIGPWAVFIGQPEYQEAWGCLLHSVRTGENAFRHVHGMSNWEYRARNPEAGAVFDRAMTGLSRIAASATLAACNFARFETVVDVGGGQGAFLASVLATSSSLRGVLFDQPHVVAGANAVLQAAGIADRCEVIGGDFFKAIPRGGDAYVLRRVLHDWEDDRAAAILRICRQAIGPEGRMLVIERVIAPPNQGAEAKFADLNMLVSPGGKERTREEWAALAADAGFRIVAVTAVDISASVIEFSPVDSA
jgi:O-methyltransferase/methyltransferase family protein